MRVIGVDPGTRVTGWGVLETGAPWARYVASGTIRPRAAGRAALLGAIATALRDVIRAHEPDVLGLEKAFMAKNAQSAFRIAEVRGVVLLVAGELGLEVSEFSPAEVKRTIVGNGNAAKEQIARALSLLLEIDAPADSDESDALAVAACPLQAARASRALA